MTEWEVLLCNGEILRTKQHNIYEYEGRLVFCNEDDDRVGGVAMGMWIWFRHADIPEKLPVSVTIVYNDATSGKETQTILESVVRDVLKNG